MYAREEGASPVDRTNERRMPRVSPARSLLALTLVLLATGCLVGRELSLVESETGESNIEASPETSDGGANPTTDGTKPKGSKPGEGSSGGSSGDPPAEQTGTKDGGADAEAPKQDGGAVVICSPFAKQETEPNTNEQTANPLVKGVNCGKLAVFGDEDWFTYDTGDEANGQMRLRFSAEGDATIVVRNGGLTFQGGTGSNFNFLSDGRWYIRVFSPSKTTASYVITREL